ncbi:P-II family nitrogen regulator [uncultured Vagococcus sp.]|uniref:P-II family nitrogen regulator n=1 Tax=uncultured Vagococcus sp. TaxID=189676 RepID=UPI0028D47325|nr:P-II family nitrogen regulator [uncultured Vagococcus sp.]
MKKIEAIIRQEKLSDLQEALFEQAGVKGMTVSQVLGYGHQLGWKEYVRGQEVLTTLLPKLEVNMVVTDDKLDAVVAIIISSCQTGEVGDGKIFVYDVENAIRIRTSETGEDAL